MDQDWRVRDKVKKIGGEPEKDMPENKPTKYPCSKLLWGKSIQNITFMGKIENEKVKITNKTKVAH